jgi:uncharacterized membrane protein YphA (DoxX/SURF4 family)
VKFERDELEVMKAVSVATTSKILLTLLSFVYARTYGLIVVDPSRLTRAVKIAPPKCNFNTLTFKDQTLHSQSPLTRETFSRLFMSEGAKKETTWDRMTGPKLFKSVTKLEGIHSVPLIPLRIFTGLLMIHHGSEGGILPANFNTPEFQGFIDYIINPYFGFLPGPPEIWSAIHDYIEFFGGICFTVGFLTRPVALSLFATMIGAIYFYISSIGLQNFPLGHVPNYSYDFEEPTLYAFIFFFYWFNGPVRSYILYPCINNLRSDLIYILLTFLFNQPSLKSFRVLYLSIR